MDLLLVLARLGVVPVAAAGKLKKVFAMKISLYKAVFSNNEMVFSPKRPVETPMGISAVRRSFSMAQAMENS
jgi:hypothetical protein